MALSLDDLISVAGPRIRPPRVVIYGLNGVGKTTFANKAPNPKFIMTTDGQGDLSLDRFQLKGREDDPLVKSWEELMLCLAWLHEKKHNYETVVIDTMDAAEPLLWDYVARSGSKSNIEDFGYGKGYAYAVDEARVMTDWLEALGRDRGMATIIVCQEEVKKFQAPGSESYDRYKLRLHDKLAHHLKDWCDALLFAKYEDHILKEDEGFDNTRARAVGHGKPVMHTSERPDFWAKNHYHLPHKMPLEWATFQDAIVPADEPKAPQPTKKKETAK